jgi:hypothetical protein
MQRFSNFSYHNFRCTRFKAYIPGRHNAVRDELRDLRDICVHASLSTKKELPLKTFGGWMTRFLRTAKNEEDEEE